MCKNLTLFMCAALFFTGTVSAQRSDKPFVEIDDVLIDDDAIAYSTFQSHNQKVISNDRGIFLSHIHTARAEPPVYTDQQWRLSQSTDGGKTFTTVYETKTSSNAPVLETDSNDTIYVIDHPLPQTRHQARLNIFAEGKDFSTPPATIIPKGNAGKYSMVIDVKRAQFYYVAQNSWFHIIGTDGKLRKSYQLLERGEKASMMYPLLTIDDEGVVYAAWYTQEHGKYVYRSVHAIVSRDGCNSWQGFDSTPLTLPIVDDEDGPADMISRKSSLNVHTILNGFMAKDDKLHFAYSVDEKPQQAHYVRYDTNTMTEEIRTQPFFMGRDGTGINNSGYFVSRRSVSGSTLYYVTGDKVKLFCFASDDSGQTWYEYAVGDKSYPINNAGWHGIYSIGAARELTADGHIVGVFTEVADFAKSYFEPHSGKVHFFRIQAGLSRVDVASLHYEDGKLNIRFDHVRGQPEEIRFTDNSGQWSKWHKFSKNMNVALAKQPIEYQMKSRLGVESREFDLSY